MANEQKVDALIDAMVARFKLNEAIKADLVDASTFAIEYHKKQANTIKVVGQRSTGAKFQHVVPWVQNGK